MPNSTPSTVPQGPSNSSLRIEKRVRFQTSNKTKHARFDAKKLTSALSKAQGGGIQKNKKQVRARSQNNVCSWERYKRLQALCNPTEQEPPAHMSRHDVFMISPILWARAHEVYDDHMYYEEQQRCEDPDNVSFRKWGLRDVPQDVIHTIELQNHVVLTRDELFEVLRKEVEGCDCGCFKRSEQRAEELRQLEDFMEGMEV